MSGPYVIIPKYEKLGEGFSKKEKLQAIEHPGRQTNPQRGYQTVGSWISDLTQLRKAVILCAFCAHKFNPRHFRYRRMNERATNGVCDDCKGRIELAGVGMVYVSEETYDLLSIDPIKARRKRAEAKAVRVPDYVMQESARAIQAQKFRR